MAVDYKRVVGPSGVRRKEMAETEKDGLKPAIRRIEKEPEIDPSDFTIQEIQDQVSTVDDVDVLEQMMSDEKDGQNRKGAKAALASRKDELVNDDEGEADDEEEEPTVRLPNNDDGRQVRRKIAVGQLLADEMGSDRQVMFTTAGGEGWSTDDSIVLTKSDIGPGQFVSWAFRVYRSVARGMADGDTDQFQNLVFENEDMVSNFVDSNWERSITKALEEAGYSPDELF